MAEIEQFASALSSVKDPEIRFYLLGVLDGLMARESDEQKKP